jgi:hypothetical protein
MAGKKNPYKIAQRKFKYNRTRQIGNGHEWNLSYEDWYAFFLSHGVDKNLPVGHMTKDTLCLMRKDPTKPFQVGNLVLETQGMCLGKVCRNKGSRPHTWKVKDPESHRKYLPWLKAKSQSDYRVRQGLEEGGWCLSFNEFETLWGDLWDLRGKESSDYCMTREDPQRPWSSTNCLIITRKESLQRSRVYSEQMGLRKIRRKRK